MNRRASVRSWHAPLDGRLISDELIEVAALVVSAPLLLFPSGLSIVGLVALPLVWLRRIVLRRWNRGNYLTDAALVGMLLMTAISLYPSVDLSLSRPKLYGLILGFFTFDLVQQLATTARRRQIIASSLVGIGATVGVAGLLLVRWNTSKLTFLDPIYNDLPHFNIVIQSSSVVEIGVQPNEVGGTLALLSPIGVGLALFCQETRTRLLAGSASLLMAAVILLTGSRSALAGAGLSIAGLVLIRYPRIRWVVVPAITVATAIGLRIGPERLVSAFTAIDAASGGSGLGRLDIWSRALAMIQDFPFTGIGLNTFPVILNSLYPVFSANRTAVNLPHAHNLFLQTALDLGLPGLACFIIIWIVAAIALTQSWRQHCERATAAAVGAALFGQFVFSQTDAVALGAKPGILSWACLGCAIALHRRNATPRQWRWLEWTLLLSLCVAGMLIATVPHQNAL